jgi:SAM-dependent methyltransferase
MNQNVEALYQRYYRSIPTWVDGTRQFGSLVRTYLRPEMNILNLGAGPGTGRLHFDSEVKAVVGLDPDSAITLNQHVTHRVRGAAEALPFRDETFDLVYMDWVIEHLPSPPTMARNVFRVLRQEGKFLFRTANLLHYSYAIARVTPHSFHQSLLDGRHDTDPYPTHYRMNTLRAVRRIMATAGFREDKLLMIEPNPAYLDMSRPTYLVGILYERIVNRYRSLSPFRANILGSYLKPSIEACMSQ